MRASPIGLVVTAVLGLVAVLAVLYRRNETVRRIIDTAWSGDQVGCLKVRSWFTDKAWPAFRGALSALGTKVSAVYRDYVKPGFDRIKTKVSDVWEGSKKVLNSFKEGLSALGRRFSSIKESIGKAWGELTRLVSKPIIAVIQFVNDKFLDGLETALNKIPGVKIDLPSIPIPGCLPAPPWAAGPASRSPTVVLSPGSRLTREPTTSCPC